MAQDSATDRGAARARHAVWLNRLVLLAAVAGAGLSGYLTLAHLELVDLVCDDSRFRCSEVAEHRLAFGLGLPWLHAIPTAALGVAVFACLAGLAWAQALATDAGARRRRATVQTGLLALTVLVFAGLTYAEAFVIHAWCLWCLFCAAAAVLACVAHLAGPGRLGPAVAAADRRAATVLLAAGLVVVVGLLGWRVAITPGPSAATDEEAQALRQSTGHSLGGPQAPGVLVQFGSFACPHCRAAMRTVDHLLATHPGQVRFVFHHAARRGQRRWSPAVLAAEAADRQGRYWDLHRALFEAQPRLRHLSDDAQRPVIRGLAAGLGLDLSRFETDWSGPAAAAAAARQQALAEELAAFPPPNFWFINGPDEVVSLPNARALKRWLADPANWPDPQTGR